MPAIGLGAMNTSLTKNIKTKQNNKNSFGRDLWRNLLRVAQFLRTEPRFGQS